MNEGNYKLLELKDVVKVYGENTSLPVKALKGVSLSFRKNEFVAVLGQSGCGKTTLLNIIGGLDNYTEGDLIIEGVSTENYTDRDWDAYRNHSVGFVFQSYNLIPHQTVIKNVELALTLSGVDKETRREKAFKALERVGLKDQVNKLPNQLSGGQMQRVAIARAIVNDPEIILADEPTGALDSETSVQIMDLLKELSKTKLVIMVTHNGELAEEYATRIVTLSDGKLTGDSMPVTNAEEKAAVANKRAEEKAKKPSMSLLTAFSLSLNNLITKKARTLLTSIAGSIGIIGIALILSLSAGFNTYIATVQRDTLSNYPITINSTTMDTTNLLGTFMGANQRDESLEKFTDEEVVSRQDMIFNMLENFIGSIGTNDLASFKKYLTSQEDLSSYVSAVSYSYNLNLQIYANNGTNHKQVRPVRLPSMYEIIPPAEVAGFDMAALGMETYYNNFGMMMGSSGFSEMIDNQKLLSEQYDVLKGHWPENANEVVLVVDEYNQISDLNMYKMGLLGDYDVAYIFQKMILNVLSQFDLPQFSMFSKLTEEQKDQLIKGWLLQMGYTQTERTKANYTFDDLLKLEYNVLLPAQTYGIVDDTNAYPLWAQSEAAVNALLSSTDGSKFITEGGTKVKVSAIVRLKENVSTGSLSTTICYTKALTDLLIDKNYELPLTKQILDQEDNQDKFPSLLQTLFVATPEGGVTTKDFGIISSTEYQNEKASLHVVDKDTPTSIAIYPISFEAKDKVTELIDNYNKQNQGDDSKQIKYTDTVGLMMSSITTIINAITYVLIAFVSISLVVSSIMIGVITHISVLERTKEIGVLRSIGASKRDISRVFNAETAIIGLSAGLIGILFTLLLIIPINIIIGALSGLHNIAGLPVWGGIILVVISVLLTVIAGLIPARKASKKDPVIALRSE